MTSSTTAPDTLSALEHLAELLHHHSDCLGRAGTASGDTDSVAATAQVLSSLAALQAATLEADQCVQAGVKRTAHRLGTLNEYTRILGDTYPEFAPSLKQMLHSPLRSPSSAFAQGSASPQTPGPRTAAGVCSPLLLPRTPLQAEAATPGHEASPALLLGSPMPTPSRPPRNDAGPTLSAARGVQRPCCPPRVASFLAALAPAQLGAPCGSNATELPRKRESSRCVLRHVDDLVLEQLRADGVQVESALADEPLSVGTPPAPHRAASSTSAATPPTGASLGYAVLVDIREGLFAPLSAEDACVDPLARLHSLFPRFSAFRAFMSSDDTDVTSPAAARTRAMGDVDAPQPTPTPQAGDTGASGALPGGRRRPRSPAAIGVPADGEVSDEPSTGLSRRVLETKVAVCRELSRGRLKELMHQLLAVVALRHLAWLGQTSQPLEAPTAQGLGDAVERESTMAARVAAYLTALRTVLAEPGDGLSPASISRTLEMSPPPLLCLDHVFTALGYATVWGTGGVPRTHAATTASGDGAVGADAIEANHAARQTARFVRTVAPFLALWCPSSSATGDAVALPRSVPPVQEQGTRSSSGGDGRGGQRGTLCLSSGLAPLAWRDVTCEYLQACVRGVMSWRHDSCVAQSALEQGTPTSQPTLDEWWTHRRQGGGAAQESFPAPPHTGLSSLVYPVSTRLLTTLTTLDERGLLPFNESDDDDEDRASEAAAGEAELQRASADAAGREAIGVGDDGTPDAALSEPLAINMSMEMDGPNGVSLFSFADAPPRVRGAGAVLIRAMTTFRSDGTPLVSVSSAGARRRTPLPQSPDGNVAREGAGPPAPATRAPGAEAVVLEMPHVSAVLREESAHWHRANYGRTLHQTVDRCVRAPGGGQTHGTSGFDLFTTSTGFDNVHCAVALTAFHSSLLFCPVSRQRCVDPHASGGVLKADALAYKELQGLPRVNLEGNKRQESSSAAPSTVSMVELEVAALRQQFFPGPVTTPIGGTRNLYNMPSVFADTRGDGRGAFLNPPDLLECGHVLSHRTVESLLITPSRHRSAASARGQILRCPYCSHESSVSRITTLSYLAN